MEVDKEILDSFAEELQMIIDQLSPLAEKIRVSYTDGPSFEKFGQVIDRIYGTAATMGFIEIAEYCKMMKAITYKCSQASNSYAMGQVKDLVLVAVPLLKQMRSSIHEPTQIRKIQYTMQKEREKAEDMSRKLFSKIRRTSTAA